MTQKYISGYNFPPEFLEAMHRMGLPKNLEIEKLVMTVEPRKPVTFDLTVYARAEDGKLIMDEGDIKRLEEQFVIVRKEDAIS